MDESLESRADRLEPRIGRWGNEPPSPADSATIRDLLADWRRLRAENETVAEHIGSYLKETPQTLGEAVGHLLADRDVALLEVERLRAAVAENAPLALAQDVQDLLEALGLSIRARPVSPHQVVQEEVLPAVRALRAAVAQKDEALRVGKDALIAQQDTGGMFGIVNVLEQLAVARRSDGTGLVTVPQEQWELYHAAKRLGDAYANEYEWWAELEIARTQPDLDAERVGDLYANAHAAKALRRKAGKAYRALRFAARSAGAAAQEPEEGDAP
jgi:hypothetical protein